MYSVSDSLDSNMVAEDIHSQSSEDIAASKREEKPQALDNMDVKTKTLANFAFHQNEILSVLMDNHEFNKRMPLEQVSKKWHHMIRPMQIETINTQRIPLRDVFPTASAAVAYFTSSSYAKNLRYADFRGLQDLSDADMDALTKACPNLEYLVIDRPEMTGDGLQYLERVPNLKTLELLCCENIHGDSLQYLKFVPNLQSLSVSLCENLDSDFLKNLEHVKGLKNLDISDTDNLDSDSLKRLKFTPDLERLDIMRCKSLNSLEDLKHVPKLKHLITQGCNQFDEAAIKNVVFTPHLQSLDLTSVNIKKLDFLEHLHRLKELNIEQCSQLDRKALDDMPPSLEILKMGYNRQLDLRDMGFLEKLTNLQELDLKANRLKGANLMDYIQYLPNLKRIQIGQCPLFLSIGDIHALERRGIAVWGKIRHIISINLADAQSLYLYNKISLALCAVAFIPIALSYFYII